jgi:basic membrane protein A
MRKNWFAILVLLLAMLLVACGGGDAEEAADSSESEAAATEEPVEVEEEEIAEEEMTFKLAAIFPGTITDADYNTLGHLGVTAVQDDLGVETAFSESVAVPDVDRVMREYIDDGSNIIFTHGGQFLNQTLELANEFPDLYFIAEADAEIADAPDNVWVIVRNMEIGAYGGGAVAAQMTETGKIGYITGLTLPLTYAEVHAIEQVIDDLDLDVEVISVWVGDFNDPSKARELADALISDNVDVIITSLNLGTLGVLEAAKVADSDVQVIAKYTDKSEFAPDHYVTSMLYDFSQPLTDIVGNIQGGQSGGMYNLGFDTGIGLQLPLQNVSSELNSSIEQLLADMKAGNIQVIKDTEPIE